MVTLEQCPAHLVALSSRSDCLALGPEHRIRVDFHRLEELAK